MSAYERFAGVYDKMGSDRFSARMFVYTEQILERLGYHPKSVLDLACGTGTAALKWAGRNLAIYGIDGSRHMLTVARRKARDKKIKIAFSHQPLTAFTLPARVDLVTCYFDSLNYLLTEADLAACFRSAAKVLYPGGYFIFDMNTIEAMKVIWGAQVYADETPDLAWVWKNCYYPKSRTAEVKATFFVRKGRTWERFDEVHAEKGYTQAEIRRGLNAAGFEVAHIYDCFTFRKPKSDCLRVAVVARRKA